MIAERGGWDRGTPVAIGAAAPCSLALAGCSASVSVGGDPELKGSEIAGTIKTQYAVRTNGLTLSELTCPDTKGAVNAAFTCNGRNSSGVELEISGTITAIDTQNDRASYDWKVTRGIAPGELYERAVVDVLRQQTDVAATEVSCPARITVVVGAKLSCTVGTDDGRTIPITLELTDLDGGFRVTDR